MRKFYRFLFSRYFFSAILILFELFMITLWVFGLWENLIYAFILGAILNTVAGIYLITKDTNPEYKIPWLFILITMPFVGALLYFFFYGRPLLKREANLLTSIYNEINEKDERKERLKRNCKSLENIDPLSAGKALSLMNADAFSSIYRDSACTYLSSGEEYYSVLISKLKTAKHFIFLEYFIIDKGYMLNGILDILREKISEGVEVRLIYDDIGCMKTISKKYEAKLREIGISCLRFNKVSPSLSTIHNNRNHRKIAIIDGKYAFTGGVNIADEYINRKIRFGHWKDGGVLVKGRAVEGFLIEFLCDFALGKGKKEDITHYLNKVKACENPDTGYYIPFASGPKPTYKKQVGKTVLLNIINQAGRYVYITTPYLIIDYELTEALRGAALRGVDVRIITPSIPDKKTVKVMTKSSYPYLMEGGVRIYEYTPGFIHEKLIVSDDTIAVIGTINLDYRSLVHHFENALWIYASPEIYKMKEGFLETMSLSMEKKKEKAQLSFKEKMIRNLIKIFAPLL